MGDNPYPDGSEFDPPADVKSLRIDKRIAKAFSLDP